MTRCIFLVLALFISWAGFSQQTSLSTGVLSEESGIINSSQNFIGGNPGAVLPDAPNIMTTWVLPSTNSTSGNSRIPRNAGVRYQRCEYLILPSEMAASGFPSGTAIDAIGFLIYIAGVGTQTGTLTIYLMNTNDVTYTLGSTWTTAGFTTVSNDPAFTVPINAGAYTIPFTGGSPFVYTGGGVYVAWEFSNPAGTMGTTSLTAFCNTNQASLCYGYQSATAQGTAMTLTAFRPATSFTNNSLVDIAAVTNIYTTERVPVPSGSPNPVGIRVSNLSAAAASFDVTLTVKDVATSTTRYTATLPVANLAAGTATVVNFTGWNPTLQENVNITGSTSVIAGETYIANNTKTIPGNVNSNRYSYNYNLTGPGGYGFTYPGTGIFAAKYKMNGTGIVKGANVLIYNYASNPGNTIFVVLMNSTGTILSQAADYVLQSADLGTNVSFTFPTPQTLTNEEFYVGLGQTAGTAQWYPLGTFVEDPARGNTFYIGATTGGTLTADGATLKYAIEAIVVSQPTVITNTATSVTSTTATLNGSVNANGENTTVTFQYGPTISYGTTVAGVPGTVTGTTATAVNAPITGLTPNTLYHFRAVGVSPGGTTYGNDLTFTTPPPLPTVVTSGATGIGATTATLNGTVTALNTTTTVTFEYGPTTSYGTVVAATPGTVTGNTATPVSSTIGGLTLGNTYHFRCVGANSNGTVNGLDQQFTTGCIPPVPTITGSATTCQNAASNVYSTQPGMTNYTWTISAGGNITAGLGTSAITVTWTSAGPKVVNVNYTNASGCAGLAPAAFNVTVNPAPAPTITGSVNHCANSGYYTYTTEPGQSNYTWTISSGNTIYYGQGTNQVMVTWANTGSQSISVNYTNANGCQAAAPATLAVTVNSVPAATGAITGTASVCGGATGVAYSVAAVTGAVAYVWSLPDGANISSGAGTRSIQVDFDGDASSGNITCYANNLCGNGSVSPAYALTVTPLPSAAGTIGGSGSVCEGYSNQYAVTPIPNATTYLWTVPAGANIVAGAGTNMITVDFPVPLTGDITVAGSNSCGNGASSSLPVVISPIPETPVITLNGSILTSSAPTGNQWYKDGSTFAGGTSQTVDAALHGSGWYWNVVMLNYCTSDTSNNIYVLITGTEDLRNGKCNIYPNPSDGRFTIVFPEKINTDFNIRVINAMGQLVKNHVINAADAGSSYTVDMRPLADGMYTIEIAGKNLNTTKRIVVKKN